MALLHFLNHSFFFSDSFPIFPCNVPYFLHSPCNRPYCARFFLSSHFFFPLLFFFPTILSRCCVILSKLFSAHQPESYNPLFLFSFIDVWNFHHRSIKKFIELGFLISEYRFWLWIEGVVVRFYCMVLDLQDFHFYFFWNKILTRVNFVDLVFSFDF